MTLDEAIAVLVRFKSHLNQSLLHWLEIHCEECLISITSRPRYCDRGKYLVMVDTFDQRLLHIDGADMFPRYYFIYENMWSEVVAWIEKRNLNVVSITCKGEPEDVRD